MQRANGVERSPGNVRQRKPATTRHPPAALTGPQVALPKRSPRTPTRPAKAVPGTTDLPRRARLMIDWFKRSARDLPWRRTTDPYAIWVSEIMLQQTQVATVIPYWERWLREFPDPATLSAAPEARVLKLWEGLGYYSRARNLQRAAQTVVREHAGRLPDTVAGLQELAGIGPYTAGAIASIAYNQPAALLDGNVIRVLTRHQAWPGDPRSRELNTRLWAEAQQLVDAAARLTQPRNSSPVRNCSSLNQALMELGATVCTPTSPRCDECPWQQTCAAKARGQIERFPETAARPKVEQRYFATALLRHQGRWLVRQRPTGIVNAGYWEFPNLELPDNTEPRTALAQWLGIPLQQLEAAGTLRHAITRYRMTQHLYRADVPRAVALESARWVSPAELAELALTGPHRRLAATLT